MRYRFGALPGGGEQAAKGVILPLGDLIIAACALELGYAIGTSNARDFIRIPGNTFRGTGPASPTCNWSDVLARVPGLRLNRQRS